MPNIPAMKKPEMPGMKMPAMSKPSMSRMMKKRPHLRHRKSINDDPLDDPSSSTIFGWLKKSYVRKGIRRKSTVRFHKWWFVLNVEANSLCYFHKEGKIEDVPLHKPKGWLDLSLADPDLSLDPAEPLQFEIKFLSDDGGENTQALRLVAPDEQAHQMWTESIKRAITKGKQETKSAGVARRPRKGGRPGVQSSKHATAMKYANPRIWIAGWLTLCTVLWHTDGILTFLGYASVGSVILYQLCVLIVHYYRDAKPHLTTGVHLSDDEEIGDSEHGSPPPSPASSAPSQRKKHQAGVTVHEGPGVGQWHKPDPASFDVRMGPNYKVNGKKGPSNGQVLSVVAFDIYKTAKKIDHIAAHLTMPPVDYPVKQWLVIQGQLPDYAPPNPVFSSQKDGPGYSIVFYSPITPEIWDQCEKATSGHLKLLSDLLHANKSHNPQAIYDNMKFIGRLDNVDDPKLNISGAVGKMVRSYNAKPILTRPQHHFVHTESYLEVDVNVHEFAYMARQGVRSYLESIAKMELSLAFVIQGTADNELPEVVLCAVALNKVDFKKAVRW